MEQERLISYLHSLEQDSSALLREIEMDAKEHQVPIVRREMAAFLRTMVVLKNPQRILEVGCATGYSALVMAEKMRPDAHITTIEKYEKRIPAARENFRKAGMEDKITLMEGDAMDILPSLTGTYDFIFMDAAKGQYIHFLPLILPLMPPGGILISDNILQEGDLLESRYAVTRRDRTIHTRMREYIYACKHDPRLESSVLPLGDGAMLSVRTDYKGDTI